jgi:hypothetical protein
MLRSTDFASKGLYKDKADNTQSQSIFKEVANLRLAGNTFDAGHMEKFIKFSTFAANGSPSKGGLSA